MVIYNTKGYKVKINNDTIGKFFKEKSKAQKYLAKEIGSGKVFESKIEPVQESVKEYMVISNLGTKTFPDKQSANQYFASVSQNPKFEGGKVQEVEATTKFEKFKKAVVETEQGIVKEGKTFGQFAGNVFKEGKKEFGLLKTEYQKDKKFVFGKKKSKSQVAKDKAEEKRIEKDYNKVMGLK